LVEIIIPVGVCAFFWFLFLDWGYNKTHVQLIYHNKTFGDVSPFYNPLPSQGWFLDQLSDRAERFILNGQAILTITIIVFMSAFWQTIMLPLNGNVVHLSLNSLSFNAFQVDLITIEKIVI
jgi:hypothetical protein